jgi:hypothetical protein
MIEENGHQVSDFGTTTFRQRQSAKPRLDLYGSDLSKLVLPPMGKNPPGQICLVDFLGRATAPGVVLCEFPLLEMIAELSDRQ